MKRAQALRRFAFTLFGAALAFTWQCVQGAQSVASDPDRRAADTEKKMTDAERIRMIHGLTAVRFPGVSAAELPSDIPSVAGYVPGIPRLGIPALLETDGGAGIANIPEIMRPGDSATAFPSMLALGASFDRKLAYDVGAAMGTEAKGKGFNVLLAGGVNLTRDPRGGRNTEYLGEDPLVSGVLGGLQIRGTQDQGVIATVKHFALYTLSTPENTFFDAHIDETALRESDLLAFELAIRIGKPGAVMCSYNQLNGQYACGNAWLLNTVLMQEWHYPGWVMSDWGAIHADGYLEAGLDQASGEQLDNRAWFGEVIQSRIGISKETRVRVSDAVRRILRTMYRMGLDRPIETRAIDFDKDLNVAQNLAGEGIVLLKNDGMLPINASIKNVLVIGGNAHIGVLAQGGWTTVTPVGETPFVIPTHDVTKQDQRHVLFPPGPYQAIKQALPDATVLFDTGYDSDVAARRASAADVVILFATRWQSQTQDAGNLDLPEGQDLLIEKVAKANPRTVVVLETGNPVLMPWLGRVGGVLETWYPGQRGAAAIAEILVGARNPSGHLPMTFPTSNYSAYPPLLVAAPPHSPVARIDYTEGPDFGYRRLRGSTSEKPLFPFGYGLSYTQFKSSDLKLVLRNGSLYAKAEIQNAGSRRGADVVQIYLVSATGSETRRLVGFERVDLAPGEKRIVSVDVEPRVVARWRSGRWDIPSGLYAFAICTDSATCGPSREVNLDTRSLKIN